MRKVEGGRQAGQLVLGQAANRPNASLDGEEGRGGMANEPKP